jgi:hypothetical protein
MVGSRIIKTDEDGKVNVILSKDNPVAHSNHLIMHLPRDQK